jgi:hypothetical protein
MTEGLYVGSSGSVKVCRRKTQVYISVLPELVQAYGDLIYIHLKEAVSQVVEVDWRELNRLPKDAVEEFYAKAKDIKKCPRVREDVYDRWVAIPFHLKKKAQYWINQWLLEKAKELELL